MGRLILVQGPSLDSEPPHSFDQVSRIARADKRLSDRGYRVLATIEGYCWGDRRDCWVSNRTLGEQSGGVSAMTARRAIRELEQLGYLRIEEDKTKARGHRLVLLYQLKRPGLPD
jgi:hypothetical protein